MSDSDSANNARDRKDKDSPEEEPKPGPSTDPVFPSPEELQKKLSEFMKNNFGENISFATMTPEQMMGGTRKPEEPEPKKEEPEVDVFEFNLLPRDIKRHLDRFVIKQDEAKKVLSIAVCDHYNHVKKMRRLEREDPEAARSMEYAKQNVILIGPTGVGKTYLVKHVAELIGVPFVKADATKFSETGYVGADVEDLVRELLQKAENDMTLAEYGIIYIDEIDKIASSGNMIGKDVSGRGVQTTLLKLMEETEVPTRSPNDIQAQLQAAMDMQRGGGGRRKDRINTRHILFIVSGAFDKLKEMVERRLKQNAIGFGAEPAETFMDNNLFRQVNTTDFIEYGFEPEFVGRLPVRVVCEHLEADDLFKILRESEGSIIRQYEQAFEAYGIQLEFTDDALHRLAEDAAKEKTGARGLMTVSERLLRNFKYELPASGVEKLVITEELYGNPNDSLEQLLKEGQRRKAAGDYAGIKEFREFFQDSHGITLNFTDDAMDMLRRQAGERGRGVRSHCEDMFRDYKFGMDLIRRNSGQTEFEISEEAARDPDRYLSDLVVESYRAPGNTPPHPADQSERGEEPNDDSKNEE